MGDLPEYASNPFIARLPPIQSAAEWFGWLETLPRYEDDDRLRPAHERVHFVGRLLSYFDPNERHLALAMWIDLVIRQGYLGRNPLTTSYYQRLRNDHARIARRDLSAETVPMTSTASSLTLIGVSGMGKTISTTRILNRYPETIVHSDPFHIVQVPWVRLECPYKGSVKQLCLSFFARMDELLGTDFARRHGGARSSIDGVVLQMAAIANRHAVGLIVIDEIQHLMEARGTGRDEMLNFLVTLVNHCSTPVMLIGTPRALPLLQGAFRQARRASGLGSSSWDRMARGATWDAFVTQLWSFQWTREPSPLTDEIREVLYDESQGIIDVVIKLYLVAQLRVISRSALRPGPERLDAALLRRAARVHLALIRPMIESLRSGKGQYRTDFDDLRALDAHVREVLETAVARAAAAAPSDGSLPDPILRRRSQTDTLAEALSEFGIPLDQARLMVREAEARRPGAIRDDLRAVVLALLRGEASPAEPTHSIAEALRRSNDAQDIRPIAEGGNAYAALLAAKVIVPPADDSFVLIRHRNVSEPQSGSRFSKSAS